MSEFINQNSELENDNSYETSGTSAPNSKEPKKKLKIFAYSFVFVLTFLAVFTSQILVSGQSSTSWFSNLPVLKQIKDFVQGSERKLKGEESDRINILLLGIGGKGHDGAYLTDTIILASLEPSTKKTALISIPRDLAVPVEGMGQQKINAINAYAESKDPGSGGLAVSQAVSDLLNIPVDYYIRVDFQGFINIIDELGGIEVEVENTLDDYSYPILGNEDNPDYNSRYEHLHVDQGLQTMDGGLALKYARSRHGVGVEGSDFARAKRQQKIIEAVKDKALSASLLFRPTAISNIAEQLEDHVITNLKVWEMIKLWDMFKDIKKENIINKVLDNSTSGLLVDGVSSAGAYILVPRSGDFAEIQYFVSSIFSDAPREAKTNVTKQKATVEVRNGTWINGLASKLAVDIEKYGFTVVRIGNSSRHNIERSVIYDLTYGEKNESLTILKRNTGANVSLGIPDWLAEEISREVANENDPIKPDFLLVLGQDADATHSGNENPE
ncbi:MAG: putative transcriptional regulator YvhJ [Parcubacteria group bacterium ADurb.Bin316]|nr:MAG: putative transcriptional regulator YvhJ [Parcubacteria group bacterium ADurb.Bin316]